MLNIILPKKSPLVNSYAFDAVLEDTLEMSMELTRYPVESGVSINDHRIVNPTKYFIKGVYGSKPLKPLISPATSISDLAGIAIGAATNLLRKNPLVAAIGGLSAGFLAGSQATRASSALEYFVTLMRQGQPFNVDAVDVQLKNMVITKLSRTKDPSNEMGMILVLEIQEIITVDRINANGSVAPSEDQLPMGDPARAACVKSVSGGLKSAASGVTAAVASAVKQAVVIPRTLPSLPRLPSLPSIPSLPKFP